MDPLSISAGTAGLVSLTDAVFRLLCQYKQDVKDSRREIEQLCSETRQLSVILHELSLLAISLENSPLHGIFQLDHVESCERILQDLKTKIDKHSSEVKSTNAVKATVARLKWPLSSKECQTFLAELTRHKDNLSMALSADPMKALLQLLSTANDIRESVQEIKTRIFVDEKRQRVLGFFLSVYPQANLETSIQLRHPMTGL
ncbi:hypothetical protein BJX70DRAFT_397842 [Aspergillus crustosus]